MGVHPQGYKLGSASLQFNINMTLTMPTNSSSNSATRATESLQLGPSVPLAVSTDRLVSAKLLGDLATYTQLPAVRCDVHVARCHVVSIS